MKKFSDFKEEIHRCSKCGLCQAECPLYEITGNECTVSRGQFIMLDGVLKNKLKLGKNINKYLDLCLKCNKCSEYCPSGIDVVEILLAAKNEYFEHSLEGKIYSFFESKLVFNTVLNIIRFFTKLFTPNYKSKNFETKAVYFGGCVSALKPDVKNYVVKLLNKIKIEVIDIDVNCCGMPFLTTGNFKRFREAIEENLNKIPAGVNTVITDCASCEWAWKNYYKYLTDEKLKDRLSELEIKNIYEIIDDNDIKFIADKNLKISYHKPCHEHSTDSIVNIIKNIKNCDYTPMENYDSCCGFASYEHPSTLKTTAQIREKKKKSLKSVDADVVLTSCVGCMISLSLISKKRVRRLLSFLKDFCKVD